MSRRGFLALVCTLSLTAGALAPVAQAQPPLEPYRSGDESAVALNLLPPGQGRYLNAAELAQWQANGTQPSMNTDQLALYDFLVQAAPTLSAADLPNFFKDASFGVKPEDVVSQSSPRSGVVIQRDGFGVPHVYGVTRADGMFGVGYVTGQDRLFMIDVLRHLARGRLSELLGGSPANVQSDRAVYKFADYEESELQAMLDRGPLVDPVLGARARQDIIDFTAGVNQFIAEARLDATKRPGEYDALQIALRDWAPTDSVALASLIGSQFSVGGGGQLLNARFLKALEDAGHAPADARAIFDDFRRANDPEAPTSTEDAFPFNTHLGPPSPAAVAFPDDPAAVIAAIDQPPDEFVIPGVGSVPFPFGNNLASNALLVNADRSVSGRPLAVMGPQVGYFSPQILMEIDVHAPGLHGRGAAFPGISLYVLLGRGASHAWSATTAVGDHMDIRAVRLCEPGGGAASASSIHYLDDGVCTALYRRTDTWLAKPSAAGIPAPGDPTALTIQVTTERTRHGIVQARGTVGGEWAAFVLQRSSYMAEVDSALAFVEAMDPDLTRTVADLQRAFSRFNFSFNWHFVDAADAGFFTTGLYPVLAQGVDPDLPFWGDSQWDWTRFLTFEEHPQALSPAKGYVVNWNNKQAPQFRSPDDFFAYGSIQRVQLLDDGVKTALADDGRVSLEELTQAMAIAATQDLRGVKILPFMRQVVGTTGNARLDAALALLAAWEQEGAHRRDFDLDGQYEHQAAIALMDRWWTPALRAVFLDELGSAFGTVPLGHTSNANPGGSAYGSGWYGQLEKDLRSVLGEPVVGPFSRQYCGGGVLAACRAALVASLDEAVTALESQFGPNPASWDVDETAEKINFSAIGLVTQRRMQWQNRPTFQQVLMFDGPEGTCGIVPASSCRGPVVPGKAQLLIRDRLPDSRDTLVWRWLRGATTPKTAFGNPLATTGYNLCLYDGAGTLTGSASVPAGGACNVNGTRPCWRERSKGFDYVDRDLTPDGIQRLGLREGIGGKAKIILKGKGGLLSLPALPVSTLPLRVQLTNTDGECWEASYSTTFKNTDDTLKAKSD